MQLRPKYNTYPLQVKAMFPKLVLTVSAMLAWL